jgi:hypothetical protein
MKIVDLVISLLKCGRGKFDLVDQGSIDKYLGLLIRDIDLSMFKMSQPFLIQRILDFLSLDENKSKGKETPVGKPLLNWDLDGVSRKHPWLYCGAVGMLSYLSNSVWPEIQMAVHQTARFSVNPLQSHELAIMRIGRYLIDNPDRGIQYKIDKSKGLEVYADADFAGGWSAADSEKCRQCLIKNWLCYLLC